MPRGKRTLPTLTCCNADWQGCTQPHWKMRKKFAKHEAECKLARSREKTTDIELRPLVDALLARMTKLEDDMVQLRVENQDLRKTIEDMKQRRAPYRVRKKTIGVPRYGFGNWSASMFCSYLPAVDAMYREKRGIGVLSFGVTTTVAAVFYAANGNAHVVCIPANGPKDRHGRPKEVLLNYAKKMRTVTIDAALKRLFDSPFLPTVTAMEEALGYPIPPNQRPSIEKQHNILERALTTRPCKNDKKLDSMTEKYEILKAFADYSEPTQMPNALAKVVNAPRATRAQRHTDNFNDEMEGCGRFWRNASTEMLVDFDGFCGECPEYVTILNEFLHFPHNAEKLKAYREAGGTLV